MKKELTVDEWFSEIRSGLEYRKEYGREDVWAELEALFYEAKGLDTSKGPNLINSIGDAIVSHLGSIYPYIMTRPKRQDSVQNAKILESVDNSLLEELDLPDEMGTAILHAYLWGRGFLKLGYDSEFGWNPAKLSNPEQTFGMSLSQFDSKGNRIEYCEKVKPGMPWVSTVLPHDIVVPWGVSSLKDTPYIAHRVIRHIDDIKSDVKYSGKRDLQPTMTGNDVVNSYLAVGDGQRLTNVSMGRDVPKAEFVEMWEIRDVRTNKIKVIATGHDKFLRNEYDYLQTQGLPFVSFAMVPQTRNFWVTPDAYYLLPYQEELNDISVQAAKMRKLAILKFLYSDGAIDETELQKLFSPDIGAGVRVNQGIPLNEAVQVFTPHNPNMNLYAVDAEYVRRNSRETVGFSRNQLGEYEQKGRRTASEVMAVQDGSNNKMNRRQLVIRRAYLDIFKKLNSIIFTHWRTPKWVEVGGDWVEYDGQMLKSDYSYDLVFAQKNPISSPVERAMENLNLYSMLVQDPYIDQVGLRNMVQSAMPNPEHRKVFRTDANIPLQMQQMQQGNGPVQPNQ